MTEDFRKSSSPEPTTDSAATNLVTGHARAKINEGRTLHQKGQLTQAQQIYEEVLKIQPNNADVLFLLGAIAYQTKNLNQALEWIGKSIEIDPSNAAAHSNLGIVLNSLKQHQAAVDSYDKAISLRPGFANAYSNRGNALNELKQHQAAVDSYERAITLKPDLTEAHYNRGNALCDLGRYTEAVDSYDKAIALTPNLVKVHYNRGDALTALKQYPAAIESYDKAIALRSDYSEAYFNRGNVLNRLNLLQAALDSYDKAIAINPDFEFLHGIRLHTKMKICDWSNEEDQFAGLLQRIQRNEKASSAFAFLALSGSLPLQRKAAEAWVNAKHPTNPELGSIGKRLRGKKIRVAYFSMDFRNHPVSFLAAGLFETHDRDNFEIYAFSFGPDTKDEMRLRLETAFDKFIDVKNKSDLEIAELAREMKIDIAVDLAGFTTDSRTGIFAFRAAPLQVNYLGYPGTMGAAYIDYLIADKTLIPDESRQHYSEKIVYLPSFQVNDSRRKISERVFTREELGLPQAGFVFCCFNSSYKIMPNTFDGWMRILKQVDQSVLFLYAGNEQAEINLKKEAARRGVDAGRLVFGKQLPLHEHLSRYRVADLFLDTLPFNAGTTASDALWAGLPVLTCSGEAFASRMATSLLTSIGLPELITTTQDDYEILAVELATDPERLQAIRLKLERNRLSTPLFDTKVFTRNIEDAYTIMVERYRADLPPDDIYVMPLR